MKTLETLGFGVRSMCIVMNIAVLTEEDPENDSLHKFPKIRKALDKAVNKGIDAVVNLLQAIQPSFNELESVCDILESTARKKKKYTFMTWWLLRYYHYHKASKNLCQKVDCDKIKLNANDPKLLKGFEDTIAAYEEVKELCEKQSKGLTSSLLQTACKAAVIILKCAQAGVLGLQVYGMVSMQPINTGVADSALKDLIDACKNKRRSLARTTQANKQLMERTEREVQELTAEYMKVIQQKMENAETGLNKLCELVTGARNSRRKMSVLLRDQRQQVHKYHEDMKQLRGLGIDLISRSRNAESSASVQRRILSLTNSKD